MNKTPNAERGHLKIKLTAHNTYCFGQFSANFIHRPHSTESLLLYDSHKT